MSCSAGSVLNWPPVKSLVDKIDQTANTLGTPDYEKLVDMTDKPFRLRDKVQIDFWQTFDVGSGGYIQNRYMASGEFSGSAMSLPEAPNTEEMARNDELYFISDETGCLCITLFKVVYEGGGYSLDTADATGCCQDFEVPQRGSSLPDGNGFIPSNPTTAWVQNGNPIEGQTQYSRGPCKHESSGVGYVFSGSAQGSPLQRVSRNFTGYLTWPAKSEHFQKMWDNLEQIRKCTSHGGSHLERWEYAQDVFVPENCTPTIEQAMEALKLDGSIAENPGCLYEIKDGTQPWDDGTCGGDTCEGDNKLYCETIKDLETYADALGDRLKRKSGSSNGCCCSYGVSVITECTGSAYDCAPPSWEKCSATALEREIKCEWKEEGEDEECTWTYNFNMTSPRIVTQPGDDFCDYSNSGEPCGPPFAFCYDENVNWTEVADMTPKQLMQEAEGAADCDDNKHSVSIGDKLDFDGYSTGCFPGSASVRKGYWKVTGSHQCPDGQKPGAETVKIKMELMVDGEVHTTRSSSARVSYRQGKYESSDKPFPAMSLPEDFSFAYWALSVDGDNPRPCPSCR